MTIEITDNTENPAAAPTVSTQSSKETAKKSQ